jgi:hypothetical protein
MRGPVVRNLTFRASNKRVATIQQYFLPARHYNRLIRPNGKVDIRRSHQKLQKLQLPISGRMRLIPPSAAAGRNQEGVAYLFRYQEVSRHANQRYLDALAVVDDPTPAIQHFDDIATRKNTASGRGV